jgi:beta-lactamase regulating signal transducer with metallopeptidase domain
MTSKTKIKSLAGNFLSNLLAIIFIVGVLIATLFALLIDEIIKSIKFKSFRNTKNKIVSFRQY